MELNSKGKKCYHLRPEEEYLGKIVGRKSVKVGFIDTMDMWNHPHILKKLKDSVGLLTIIEVLSKTFQNYSSFTWTYKKTPLRWDEKHEHSFECQKCINECSSPIHSNERGKVQSWYRRFVHCQRGWTITSSKWCLTVYCISLHLLESKKSTVLRERNH